MYNKYKSLTISLEIGFMDMDTRTEYLGLDAPKFSGDVLRDGA